jgi:predicted amidohydrolase
MRRAGGIALLLVFGAAAFASQPEVRVCAAQPPLRLVDWRLKPAEALAEADKWLGELERMVHRAGDAGCDVLAFPEDTLGLLHWEVGNKEVMKDVLPEAVARMLQRLGQATAAHRMYLVCSNDTLDRDGRYRNTAFFLGRDGKEIGQYHKVQPTITESDRERGDGFPVFETPDLGGVGMLICYDMAASAASLAFALASVSTPSMSNTTA